MSWLSHLLPRHLRQLLEIGQDERTYSLDVFRPSLAMEDERLEETQDEFQVGEEYIPVEQITTQAIEVYPDDPAIRKQWFSLTTREREVAALTCMGYRIYQIADMLVVGYGTVQTHLQAIANKLGVRGRNDIRSALISWHAEEWWSYHHH